MVLMTLGSDLGEHEVALSSSSVRTVETNSRQSKSYAILYIHAEDPEAAKAEVRHCSGSGPECGQ
jgi:hypothetical protein